MMFLLLVSFVLVLQSIFCHAASNVPADGTQKAVANLVATEAAKSTTTKSTEETAVLWVIGITWLDACSRWWVAARTRLLVRALRRVVVVLSALVGWVGT